MKKNWVLAATAAVALLAGSSTAFAARITPTDLDGVTKGTLVAGGVSGVTDDFLDQDSPPVKVGSLTNWVYYNSSTKLFTYVHRVTPAKDYISEFHTTFDILGFNQVAGYSYSDSSAAGGLGIGGTTSDADFRIDEDGDGTVDWATRQDASASGASAGLFFGIGDSIDFFFQSTFGPGVGDYELINSSTGVGTSFKPVLLPPAALMGLGLLGGLGLLTSRRKRRSA